VTIFLLIDESRTCADATKIVPGVAFFAGGSLTDQAARWGEGAIVASAGDQSCKSDSTIEFEARAGGIDLTLRAALSKRNSKARQ
jgi:hypothetical protein